MTIEMIVFNQAISTIFHMTRSSITEIKTSKKDKSGFADAIAYAEDRMKEEDLKLFNTGYLIGGLVITLTHK